MWRPWRLFISGWLLTAQNLETAAKVCGLMARKHQMTLKLIKEQVHINHELVRQIHHIFGKEETLSEVCATVPWMRNKRKESQLVKFHTVSWMSNRRRVTTSEGNSTQSHEWATWEKSQLVKTSSRPVKPTHCTVTEDILGVSVWSWHIMSEHGMQTKIISENPKVLLAKVENQNNVDCFFDEQGVIHKASVPEGQRVQSEFYV